MDTVGAGSDPLKTYIIDLLSSYKARPIEANATFALSRPSYVCSSDWQTNIIVSAIDKMASRMWAAESKLLQVEKEQRFDNNYQDTNHSSHDQPLAVNDKNLVSTPTTSIDQIDPILGGPEQEITTLKSQIHQVSRLCKAISEGDFSQTLSTPVHDEAMAQLTQTINLMVDALRLFSGEFIRVVEEIGLDGKLGGQVIVPHAQGTWLKWANSVNTISTNLKNQVHSISLVTRAIFHGDLSKEIEVDASGEILELKNTINQLVVQQRRMTAEIGRVATEMCIQGVLGGQAIVPNVKGVWSDLVLNINTMAQGFTNQVRSVLGVTKAIAVGDFTVRIEGVAKGKTLELQESVNGLSQFLAIYTNEMTRVAREIGLNGRLGEQARMRSAAGKWKGLMDAMNVMINNVTLELRCIAVATTAIARGDLTQKISGINVAGEMLTYITTVNDMIDELAEFAVQVKRTARGVGVDGSKALENTVSSVLGIWQELRACVDEMAGNY